MIREFPARIEIPLTEEVSEEKKALYNSVNCPLRIRFAHQNTLPYQKINPRKQGYLPGKPASASSAAEVAGGNEARKLVEAWDPTERLSTMMHHTRKTIQNYLDPGYSVTNGHYMKGSRASWHPMRKKS